MCTVTFLPLGDDDFIFTSNRDEQVGRETKLPEVYEEEGMNLLYPKDVKAGGTWIALSEKKRLVCLLNGGFKKHKHTGNYKFSRGLVVKEALKANDSRDFIQNFDLEGVEPFTLIIVDWEFEMSLLELVWDGEKRHIQALENKPKIWSSSTLYTDEMKKERQTWFSEWMESNPQFSQKNILKFHKDTTRGTVESALKMKRSYVETVSITSVLKEEASVQMLYKDLVQEQSKSVDFLVKNKFVVIDK